MKTARKTLKEIRDRCLKLFAPPKENPAAKPRRRRRHPPRLKGRHAIS